MRTSEQALLVFEQLKQAISDTAVEAIILAFAENDGDRKQNFEQLEALIDHISPLDCNSQQWRNFRVARICIGKLGKLPALEAVNA
jgi:hypothetical protein